MIKKSFVFSICLLFISGCDNSQQEWPKHWGTGEADSVISLLVDNNNNIFVLGNTNGAFENYDNKDSSDSFLTKFNQHGDIEFTKQWGSVDYEHAESFAIDDDGNLIVCGWTNGKFAGKKKGLKDAIVVKFKNNGETDWAEQWGTSKSEYCYGVAVNSENDIFVTGSTEGELGEGFSDSSANIFLTKFSKDGKIMWSKQWGTAMTSDSGQVVAVDSKGNIFVSGKTIGDLDGNKNIKYGNSDVFLTKFSSDGNKLWTKQWGTRKSEYCKAIAIDSKDNVLVAGETTGNFENDIEANDNESRKANIFITKLNNDGDELWTKQVCEDSYYTVNAMFLDDSENIFINGITVSPSETEGVDREENAFITKFDIDGNIFWTENWNTQFDCTSSAANLDKMDNIFLTGSLAPRNPDNSDDIDVNKRKLFLMKINNK